MGIFGRRKRAQVRGQEERGAFWHSSGRPDLAAVVDDHSLPEDVPDPLTLPEHVAPDEAQAGDAPAAANDESR